MEDGDDVVMMVDVVVTMEVIKISNTRKMVIEYVSTWQERRRDDEHKKDDEKDGVHDPTHRLSGVETWTIDGRSC